MILAAAHSSGAPYDGESTFDVHQLQLVARAVVCLSISRDINDKRIIVDVAFPGCCPVKGTKISKNKGKWTTGCSTSSLQETTAMGQQTRTLQRFSQACLTESPDV